jgi:hypothetical protein
MDLNALGSLDDVLLRNDGIGTRRDRSTREDADGCPRLDGSVGPLAGGDLTDDSQDGPPLGGGDVHTPEGVAVHGRTGPRRLIGQGPDGFGGDPAQGLA